MYVPDIISVLPADRLDYLEYLLNIMTFHELVAVCLIAVSMPLVTKFMA